LVKATIDGVVRPPSALAITVAAPPSITATHELVVPRSIPITLAILLSFPNYYDLVKQMSCIWFAGIIARLVPGF
jgi:hypothetical protein